jgi:SAM-dependent methyltransferase
MNYFAHTTAAERYAAARPYFHPLVTRRILGRAGRRFQDALDVACGTGMGARALLEIADNVTGVDVAPEMLKFAQRDVPGARFLESSAEKLPFEDASFDLITVFLAYHWFDQPRFLREARRLLVPGAWLVICNHWFLAELRGKPEFQAFKASFYPSYPVPPRKPSSLEAGDAGLAGFEFVGYEEFEHDVRMDADQLAIYISTQSNIIARVEQGEESLENVLETIRSGVAPMLEGGRGAFQFKGAVWFACVPHDLD